MSIPVGTIRSQVRLTKPLDLGDLYDQLAAYLEREQNGGINQLGLRLQLRASAPVQAPTANQPNYVLVENPSGLGPQPYVYVTGTGWTAVAQTTVPSPHVLATTLALGSQHTVSGLTSGQVLKATGATTAVFVQLNFSELAGNLAFSQLPTNGAGGTWSAGGAVALTGGSLTVPSLVSSGTAQATEFLGPSVDSGSATDLLLQRNNVTKVTLTSADIDFVGAVDSDTSFKVSGTKVVGAQGAAVGDASGGVVTDAEARTALNDLLARVRAHGLIAT